MGGYFKIRVNKNRHDITYPGIRSSIAPVPHSAELSVPRPTPKDVESEGEHFESESEESYVGHTDEEKKQPYFPNQQELEDLIQDLGLTNSNAKLLTQRLMEWNLLNKSCICVWVGMHTTERRY